MADPNRLEQEKTLVKIFRPRPIISLILVTKLLNIKVAFDLNIKNAQKG